LGANLKDLHLIPHGTFMDLELEGKRALITRSSAGFGYALAERLALGGAPVIINGCTFLARRMGVEKAGLVFRAGLCGICLRLGLRGGFVRLGRRNVSSGGFAL